MENLREKYLKSKNYQQNTRYTEEELMKLGIQELRNICINEKIIIGVKYYNNDQKTKNRLIELILKYKGYEEKIVIRGFCENGFERVQDFLNMNIAGQIPARDKVTIPAKINLHFGLGIRREDEYMVSVKGNLGTGNILLVNGNNYLCGIIRLESVGKDNEEYYLAAEAHDLRLHELKNKNYSLLFLDKENEELLYDIYYGRKEISHKVNCHRIELADITLEPLKETKATLCIDFGTSNTTAGCFLDKYYIDKIPHHDILNGAIKIDDINFVRFKSGENGRNLWKNMAPTAVYVYNCADKGNVKYLFGYEAGGRIREMNYSTKASVFYGIKRWVMTPDVEELLEDESGNTLVVKRSEIIKEYIKYIISAAESQFKCKFKEIHISGPVKLKTQFIAMFKKIIKDYEIIEKEALDEGMAVLYHTIDSRIESGRYREGEEYKALVIDCGGGTTDLASCRFTIDETDVSYKVKIRTTYENGDTNFGGNNITYRIMQFMKIVLSDYYTKSNDKNDIDRLIPYQGEDIFRIVDEEGVKKVYETIEKYYDECEKIIPTKYRNYENRSNDEYETVKNNFYFMWEIAEEMKKQFFMKTNILRNRFDSVIEDEKENDMNITKVEKWVLSIEENGIFKKIGQIPDIVFNIKEINKLIKADIYDIVRKFLEPYYESRELSEYSVIKLTGQSCRIDTFKEAIKEFVPGKSIEFKKNKGDEDDAAELKLSCLRGVIKYINAKKTGVAEVEIINELPVVPYVITTRDYSGREIVVIDGRNDGNPAGAISKASTVREVEMAMKDSEGNFLKSYCHYNDLQKYTEMDVDMIVDDFGGKIFQSEIDSIKSGTTKFFVYNDDETWGFFVCPVRREEELLKMGEKRYYSFDDELSVLTHFDGMK